MGFDCGEIFRSSYEDGRPCAAAIVLAVAPRLLGSADVSLKELVRSLSHHDDPELSAIVFDIRMPRTFLAASGCGVVCCHLCLAG
jgi:ABC-type Fe3+-siderophore transport system permease subunit